MAPRDIVGPPNREVYNRAARMDVSSPLPVADQSAPPQAAAAGNGSRAALSRRNRVLAHLQPILDIERDKNLAASAGGAQRDWSRYDSRLLVIAALDAVASEAGLHADGGVPRERVLAAVAAEAARCAPDGSAAEHDEVARWILDRLLNTQAASRGFAVPFTDPADGYRRRDLMVTVLYEQVASDGEFILVYAADAAVNLLLVTIDFDLEDAQVAADAVLKVQLDSGRWDDAVLTAEKALRLSRSYRDQIQARIATVRRDVRQVDWEHMVEPLLARADAHLTARLGVEQALLEHALRSAASDADPQVRGEAARVAGMLRDAIATLTRLLIDLIGARDTFRTAQLEQSFRPVAPTGSVDLERDVLEPLARLPVQAAGHIAALLCQGFGAPHVHPVWSLGRALDVLLEPSRQGDDAPGEVDAGELATIEATFSRFTDADWVTARERLGRVSAAPVRLSALIAELAHDPATLVALLALRAYTADGRPTHADDIVDGIAASDDGQALEHPTLLGPDLVLCRPGSAAARPREEAA